MATDTRSALHHLIDQLAESDLDPARAFLEFLRAPQSAVISSC